MASKYKFECVKCDFSKEVTGGYNILAGLISTITMKCIYCNNIADLRHQLLMSPPPEGSYPDDYEKVCSQCKSKNVVIWDRTCPYCNQEMKQNELVKTVK